jgi:hypothetical protein
MNKLEKLPQKNLKFILKKISEGVYEKDLFSHANQRLIRRIFDDIGIDINKKDIEFVFALYRDNPNFLTEEIKLPKVHEYEIVTKRYATISIREYWKNTHESYLDNENDVEDFISWFGGGDWWDGEMIDREEFDEETSETETDEINKLS